MDYPEILDICLQTGLGFIASQPLSLLHEAPLRFAMVTRLLNIPGVELEVAFADEHSEFLRLEGGKLKVDFRAPTNNIFENTRETCDIRIAVERSQCGYCFELKVFGDVGTNKERGYKEWERDLQRLFEVHTPRRYRGTEGNETDGKVEGAILATTRRRYALMRMECPDLLPDFDDLPIESLSTFPSLFLGRQCWMRGGRCHSFGEERAIVVVTRLFYLNDVWPHDVAPV